MKKSDETEADAMRTEYDFSKGVPNPYAARFAKGSNLVLIEPDLFMAFPSESEVNNALRTLLKAGAQAMKVKPQRQAKAG